MHRLKAPHHPGAFIGTAIIEGHELTVIRAAEALEVTPQALSELVNGRTALSADMALRLEKVFGVNMETLMRMQASYEVAQARRRGENLRLAPFPPAGAQTAS